MSLSICIKKLSLDSEGTIKDIRQSSCLLVWLLSSNKDLVFSGGDVPFGIIEHHILCCHDKPLFAFGYGLYATFDSLAIVYLTLLL